MISYLMFKTCGEFNIKSLFSDLPSLDHNLLAHSYCEPIEDIKKECDLLTKDEALADQ